MVFHFRDPTNDCHTLRVLRDVSFERAYGRRGMGRRGEELRPLALVPITAVLIWRFALAFSGDPALGSQPSIATAFSP